MSEPYRDADYPCVGVCMTDPESGYCIGCGRPPLPLPTLQIPSVTERALAGTACSEQGAEVASDHDTL